MVFPFSSATNLLQDHVGIIPTDDPQYPQGFGIERSKLTTSEATSSRYMLLAASGTIAWATIELNTLFGELKKQEDQLVE